MKKLSLAVLALLVGSSVFAASPSSSSIVLKGGGDVAPASTVNVSLASLLKEVHYDISCQVVNSNAEEVDMRFQPTGSHLNVIFGQVSLNDNLLNNLQGTLKSGENAVTVNEVALPATGDAVANLQFKNLDFNRTVQVSQCVAKPSIQKPNNMAKSGYFVAYNDTSAFVNMSVGSFFPTPYTIFPYSSRWINVSTDNQNITINSIY